MDVIEIRTDKNLQEIIEYPKKDFPLSVWRDDFEQFRDCTIGAHWHSDFEIGFLLSGELDYYMANRHLVLKKGEGFFVNSNTMHMAMQRSVEKAILIGITFKADVLGAFEGSIFFEKYVRPLSESGIRGFVINTGDSVGERLFEGIKEISELKVEDVYYELQCQSILSRLWCDILDYRKQGGGSFIPITTNLKYEDEVKRMISYIQKHYMEDILIADIAKYVGISRSECFKKFKAFTSKTPIDYILEYRLFSAACLLKSTEDTILEICTKCGFSHSSYFGKRFKERYGVTPLEYRKMVKEGDLTFRGRFTKYEEK